MTFQVENKLAHYLISYDLRAMKRDYDGVHEDIKRLGPTTRVLESTWIVNCESSIHEILGSLLKADEETNDSFLVVTVSGPWGRIRPIDETNLVSWLGAPSPIDQ
jgi:hypothetical protein